MECSLAKPQADQKSAGSNFQKSGGLLPNYPPRVGYGLVGGAYGAIGAGYNPAGFAQVRLSLYVCVLIFTNLYKFVN